MNPEDCKSGVRVLVVAASHTGQCGTIESYKPQLVRFPVLVALDHDTGVHAFAPDELVPA